MDDPAIGQRIEGRFSRHSRWFLCDICGLKYMEEETTIPDPPHPKAGLRVCTVRANCLDDLDYGTNVAITPPLPSTTEFLP